MKDKILKFLEYSSEYSLYGLIIFIPISNAAIESFFGFMFLFFVLKKIINPDFKFLKSSTHIFLLFFIFFMGLSLLNSGFYLARSLTSLFLKWLEYIFIFIIVQDTLNNSKKIRNCLIIIIGLAALIGIDALFQRFVGTDFLRHKKIVPLWGKTMIHGGAITGSFHHYNSLGAYLTFNLLLILTLLFSIGNKIYKIALFLIFVLLQACLIMTFSRGSWLGFFFGVILFLLLFPKANKLTLLVTIYIILIIFFPGLKERAMFADSDRFVVWKGTLKMIKNHPFLGMGLGTYMDYFQEYVSKTMYIRYAHNCYLQIWAESGIFSLISFMLFIGSIMFKGIRVFKKSNSFILLGLTCAFFAFLIHAFFDAQLYSLQLAVLFWFMAGLILAVVRLQGNPLIKAK